MALLVFVALLCLLFSSSFLPDYTLFSNDGPLGRLMSQCHGMAERFSGVWQDLNAVGYREGAASPSLSYGLMALLGAVGFSKFYAPLALLFLGLGAWTCFRQLGLSSLACLLGGLAAMLNSGFFSAACWGVAAHALTVGLSFFALAALANPLSPRRWWRVALAGCAVGMGVTEGADIGAIFSLLVAAFVLYQAWTGEGRRGIKLAAGLGRVTLIALLAALLAGQFITMLLNTQNQGVAGAQSMKRSPQEQWDWATQWSLPKREALAIMVPGLFGYRMDTPNGGKYWGAAGRAPAWDRYFEGDKSGPPPAGLIRYTGGGDYAGVLVGLVALWAALQALRKEHSVFAPGERQLIWFWSATALIALLLAFGRHAPFYQLVYALPHCSSIRNPAKFLHVFSFAIVVLFAYGMNAISQRYLARAAARPAYPRTPPRGWWANASCFDKRWAGGCVLAVLASLVGWLIYAAQRPALEQYLQTVQFDPATAQSIAGFSIRQVGWFILFLAMAVLLLLQVLSGRLASSRARLGGILLGLLLVTDLARANQPWIRYWDYPSKYATNPVIDALDQGPYQHRVATLPPWLSYAFNIPPQLQATEKNWDQLYSLEWSQHLFPYYNIQSLDVVQMRLVPGDLAAFEEALQFRGTQETLPLVARRWQLTNTRYLLGAAGFLDVLNHGLDPDQQRFRIVARFELVPKPGIQRPVQFADVTANPYTNGDYALFEFTGALPRAKLYTNWQVATNDQAALEKLTSVNFDPGQVVLVANSLPMPAASNPAAPSAGTVDFVSYAPRRIVLHAVAQTPSVLLLNDKFDPNWSVWVDGKPDTLLRCNYLMRGVQVPAGDHQVEFRFASTINRTSLYMSVVGTVLGLALAGFVALTAPKTTRD